jgi:hypothetical protein
MTTTEFIPLLDAYIKEQEAISGNWNGEDDSYTYGGDLYHEEDAQIAQERLEAAQALKAKLLEYDL